MSSRIFEDYKGLPVTIYIHNNIVKRHCIVCDDCIDILDTAAYIYSEDKHKLPPTIIHKICINEFSNSDELFDYIKNHV